MCESGAKPSSAPFAALCGKGAFVALASVAAAATGTAVVVVAVYRWRAVAQDAAGTDAGECECDRAAAGSADGGERDDTAGRGQAPTVTAGATVADCLCDTTEGGGGRDTGSETDSGYHNGGGDTSELTAPAAGGANTAHCDTDTSCSSSLDVQALNSLNASDDCQTTSLVQYGQYGPVGSGVQSAGHILILGRDVQLAQRLLFRISRNEKCVPLDALQDYAPAQPRQLERTAALCVADAPISLVVYIVDSADVAAADCDLRWLLCDGQLAAKLAATPVLIVGAVSDEIEAAGGGRRHRTATSSRGELVLSLTRRISSAVRARGRKVNLLLCDRTEANCDAVAQAAGRMVTSAR